MDHELMITIYLLFILILHLSTTEENSKQDLKAFSALCTL